MLKFRELFAGLAKDGADDPTRLRAAIHKIRAEHANSETELAAVSNSRTRALLDDDDAALDKLDRRAESLHRSLERCEFALPELERRLSSALSEEADAARTKRYEQAMKLAQETDKRLQREYKKAAQTLIDLVAQAADAIAAWEAAAMDMPEGRQPAELPEALRRASGPFSEEIVSTQEVARWVYEDTGRIVADQTAVRDQGNRIGSIESTGRAGRCVLRQFHEVTFLPAESRNWYLRLDELLHVPALFPADPDFWVATKGVDAGDVSDIARARAGLVRQAKPRRSSAQTRLEPI